MSTDDLLRRAADNHIANAAGVDQLLRKKPEDLFDMLATEISKPGNQFRTNFSSDDLVRSPDVRSLGKRIFMRWSVTLHAFVCKSDGEDKELRAKLVNAIVGKGGGAAAIIAGSLVAAFGLSPAVAALVAALLLQLFIIPAGKELCATWEQFNSAGVA